MPPSKSATGSWSRGSPTGSTTPAGATSSCSTPGGDPDDPACPTRRRGRGPGVATRAGQPDERVHQAGRSACRARPSRARTAGSRQRPGAASSPTSRRARQDRLPAGHRARRPRLGDGRQPGELEPTAASSARCRSTSWCGRAVLRVWPPPGLVPLSASDSRRATAPRAGGPDQHQPPERRRCPCPTAEAENPASGGEAPRRCARPTSASVQP